MRERERKQKIYIKKREKPKECIKFVIMKKSYKYM